ncbi:MAG: DNA adenine methylase [Prevotella sp.]|nr:DNA adenine methylase [Prevotella sp.]
MLEPSLFPELYDAVDEDINSTTFQNNMKLPLHRWYRYTAGFSGSWVGCMIEKAKKEGKKRIIDPFAGSGTVMVESMLHGVDSFGIESNPYVYNIAMAKLQWIELDIERLMQECLDTLRRAKTYHITQTEYPELILKCFPIGTLQKLESLKKASLEIEDDKIRNFVWFIITSILRSTSPVGTAQWQYIQPNKSKAKVIDPFDAYKAKLSEVATDMHNLRNMFGSNSVSTILHEDARNIVSVPDKWGDLVITSPPYANNYDYADAMRLEMLFWNDIKGWKDLQSKVSVNLVRACTQHVSALKDTAEEYLRSDLLSPIRDEITEKFLLLKNERMNHGGKKNYHLMIAAYFYDMARVFKSLDRVTNDNCEMCFVIGDSAPYGIYIPVDEWLGKLSQDAGFNDYSFEKLRDRNVKWKNRKHRVPLKEGRLWIYK